MVKPHELPTPAIHGPYAALITHPGYYYLYAAYADFALNGEALRRREYAELIQERLRTIQPLLAMVQPYRKSPALRVFTRRRSLERFPPEKADEAWRELRGLIERVGPPAGWRPGAAAPALPTETDGAAEAAPEGPGQPGEASAERPFPRSPVDYTQDV